MRKKKRIKKKRISREMNDCKRDRNKVFVIFFFFVSVCSKYSLKKKRQ